MEKTKQFILHKDNNYIIGLPLVQIDWPTLFEPRPYKGLTDPYYSATFIFDEDVKTEDLKPLLEIINRCKENLKNEGANLNKMKIPLHFGDPKKEENLQEEYKNKWFLRSNSKSQPIVLGKDHKVLKQDDVDIYAGCWVIPVVQFRHYKNAGTGISCFLQKLMFIEEGDRINHDRIDNNHFFGNPKEPIATSSENNADSKDEYEDFSDILMG